MALRRGDDDGFGVALGGFFTNEARTRSATRFGASGKSEILVTDLILRTVPEQERLLIINYQLFHWIPHLSRSLVDRLMTLCI